MSILTNRIRFDIRYGFVVFKPHPEFRFDFYKSLFLIIQTNRLF
ncbi:hypothetical protein LEP1GSC036_2832 [Leptospira weilii str. 2006001853]|uniref:Uncharacterized protein n=2 Tax=Leptospira weilii TaxID=28184 RepID=A0A828Z567_9LEPT|nr:hypothetical protein LEP1GSC036_2832 [Leptospira weilii str. 2006001853]EMJ63047.1 hypothetical protein LEP1GSC051_2345 [Leptospira sp. P2653]EMN44009.1 hypothetical protein LEP1GSC086_4330 [Leptospira weilii str. LNT 1234]EMN88497.1 hypothetical protein LEP1GSC108_2126 [Leptospira weilii str. UI 13098]